MSLSLVPGQSAIITRLKTIANVDVYEGQYLYDGATPPTWNGGAFKPYITTVFGSPYESQERGIASVRLNALDTTVTVYAVAATDKLSREILDIVRDKLLGFVPADGSPLRQFGGISYVDADLGANRYVHSEVFRYSANMSFN